MSLDDRLSFGEGPLEGLPPEIEPEEPAEGAARRPNRAFIFIAIAMGGLILMGILALVGALAFWVPQQKQRQVTQITRTVESMTAVAAAWTPTFTPSPTPEMPTWTPTSPPTWTPIPTATATRVVTDGEQAATEPTSTPTRSVVDDWGGTTTPSAGLGGLGAAAVAVGLTGLLFAVRKLRSGR